MNLSGASRLILAAAATVLALLARPRDVASLPPFLSPPPRLRVVSSFSFPIPFSGDFLPSSRRRRRRRDARGDSLAVAAVSIFSSVRGGCVGGDGGGSGDDPPAVDDARVAAAATTTSPLDALVVRAKESLSRRDADGAFAALADAYGVDPTSSVVSELFESCMRLRVNLAEEVARSRGVGSPPVVPSEAETIDFFQDRMGLASLLIDRERYDEAGDQLRRAIRETSVWLEGTAPASIAAPKANDENAYADANRIRLNLEPQIDRARYMLHRTNAACCRWDTYWEDGDRLRASLRSTTGGGDATTAPPSERMPFVHPFDALKFPCISLEMASNIARAYASRASEGAGSGSDLPPRDGMWPRPRKVVVTKGRRGDRRDADADADNRSRKIRVGYISPDFTSHHPLAFLMQDVFGRHDRSKFHVALYSLSRDDDGGPEVDNIRRGSDTFVELSPAEMTPVQMYERILEDEIDVLIDLCGYAGTSVLAEIMASRCRLRECGESRRFPKHVSYMGFPGSVGSSKAWDYSVFDPVVVPPDVRSIRQCYDEALVYMPHCYFVNSHASCASGGEGKAASPQSDGGSRLRASLRSEYGLGPSAFVYCCHSRPDKIDPATFRSWMRALSRARSEHFSRRRRGGGESDRESADGDDGGAPVLWLLRSGDEMERNIRGYVRREFGEDMENSLVFASVTDREEHLRRLGCADVFLDTPAYNAHTLGCDALYANVPMISLLRPSPCEDDSKAGFEFADVDAASVGEVGAASKPRLIATEKLASRVGASLLEAAGLGDLVFRSMEEYEDAMVRCAEDNVWFDSVRERLRATRDTSPLFDTERWVHNLETALEEIVSMDEDCTMQPDIFVVDEGP